MKYLNIIKRETKVMIVIVILLLMVVLGVSYALFMQVTDNTNNQVVTTGTLQVEYSSSNGYITGDTYNELLPMSNDLGLQQAGYEFSVKNTGNLPVTYNVFMYINYDSYNADKNSGSISGDLFEDLSLIKYNLQTNSDANTEINKLSEQTNKDENGIKKYNIYSGNVDSNNSINTHKLRIWLDEETDTTNIGKYIYLKLEVASYVKGQEPKTIVAAYTYNQDSTAANYCVTGDEETCEETTCYESTTEGSCPAGTIINYKVNDTETVRFHVMYDNGSTMTLQSQKNTVYNVAWIDAADYATENTDGTSCSYDSCNDEGPITILNALESATSGWSNVNNQTYTMGTTTFKTNVYTGCSSYSSCTVNIYTLPERTTKARMITVQEAADLGCTGDNESCPIWMYNYLKNSINYGGTKEDLTTENSASYNHAYWTMNTSLHSVHVLNICYGGNMNASNAYDNISGARAVIEINK